MRLHVIWLVACVLVVGPFAHADKRPRPASIVGRVVDLEIMADTTIVIVMAGSEHGIQKGWHARFREGTTKKLLGGDEAVVIRVDRRTTVLKTTLPPDQVRTHRFVQFDP